MHSIVELCSSSICHVIFVIFLDVVKQNDNVFFICALNVGREEREDSVLFDTFPLPLPYKHTANS